MSLLSRLFGIAIFCGCLVVVFLFETSSSASGFFRVLHWPAMLLTGVGPIGLMLICFDGTVLIRAFKLAFSKSASARQDRLEREAILLHELGKTYYAQGAKAFESVDVNTLSESVQTMVDRLAVRMPTKDIRELMEIERERRRGRTIQCMNVVGMGAQLAPSIGMLGTIMGMVSLLSSLEDPSHLGSHMSLALLTTFFGLFFSMVLWTPFKQKIERVMDLDLESMDQALNWVDVLEKRKPVNYFAANAELEASAEPERKAA